MVTAAAPDPTASAPHVNWSSGLGQSSGPSAAPTLGCAAVDHAAGVRLRLAAGRSHLAAAARTHTAGLFAAAVQFALLLPPADKTRIRIRLGFCDTNVLDYVLGITQDAFFIIALRHDRPNRTSPVPEQPRLTSVL